MITIFENLFFSQVISNFNIKFIYRMLSLQFFNIFLNKSTAHGCWMLDFFVSDIKLQAIYKVIHTSNYDGHISKYACKICKYNQRCIIFSCNTIVGSGGYPSVMCSPF